jgi:hypothetical protein
MSFRPSRSPANPPPMHHQLGLTRVSLTRGTRRSGATSPPFFFLLFPFPPCPLSATGATVERPVVRPWPPPWMPSTRSGAASAVHPTYRSYKNTTAARGSNPSQLGFLLPNPPLVTSRRRVKGGAGRGGAHPWECAIFVKPEPSGKEVSDQVVAARHLPMLPIHRATVFFQDVKLALHRFTNACTTARAHQVEPEFPLSHAGARHSSRWGKCHRSPPCRRARRW